MPSSWQVQTAQKAMTTLEIIKSTQVKAAAVRAAAKLLEEKYPELLESEPEIEKFVRLLGGK